VNDQIDEVRHDALGSFDNVKMFSKELEHVEELRSGCY
jgi:hypothetical protein